MKYNLSDILENSNAEETEEFIDNIKINYNETIAQKIKKRVIDGESEQSNKQSKVKHFSLKTMIAFAAVVAIILCSITAGAAIRFKMGNTFSRVFNGKNIDLNSIAADVNVASEYNGYKFEITQCIVRLIVRLKTEKCLFLIMGMLILQSMEKGLIVIYVVFIHLTGYAI